MMGRQETGQAPLFYSFNLEEHVPANHLLGGIDQFLDLSELHRHFAPHYSHTGFCRLDLEDAVPDHSTFSKNRHGRFRDNGGREGDRAACSGVGQSRSQERFAGSSSRPKAGIAGAAGNL